MSFCPLISFSQNENDGVYFEFVEKACSYKKVKLLNAQKFICISENPIINISDYDAVGKLEIDKKSKMQKFEITLSEEGSEKLVAISKLYAGKNLAFIVDDEAICLMKVKGVISSGKIIVTEDMGYSSLQKTHQNIKAGIALKRKVK